MDKSEYGRMTNSLISSFVIFSTVLSTIVHYTPAASIAYSKSSPAGLLVEVEKDPAPTSNIGAESARLGELFMIFLAYTILLKCRLWSYRYQACLANRLFDVIEYNSMRFHIEFFLEAIWFGIDMDSPDASAGAMDAPNEAPECEGDSSTILGKRPAENEAAKSCFSDTVSVERSPLHVLCFIKEGRARVSFFLKLIFRP